MTPWLKSDVLLENFLLHTPHIIMIESKHDKTETTLLLLGIHCEWSKFIFFSCWGFNWANHLAEWGSAAARAGGSSDQLYMSNYMCI